MKVLSIRQPWATLIQLGEKGVESRSRRTKYRGDLAIHASKKIDKDACRQFRSVLAKHGYTEDNLPTGVILATCKLTDCHQVVEDTGEAATLESGHIIDGNEYEFGDYEEGRFAWKLDDVKSLPESIPAKGQLGLWEHPLTTVTEVGGLSLEQVSKQQSEEMRHALGLNYKKKPYRNKFYDDANNPEWNDLVSKGFAIKGRGWDEESAYFYLTYPAVQLVYGQPISKEFYNEL